MKILIVNQHTQNFGDDAAGHGLLHLLLGEQSIDGVRIVFNGPVGEPMVADPRVSVVHGVKFKDIGYGGLLLYFLFWFWPRIRRSLPRTRVLVSEILNADRVLVAPAGANLGIYRDWQYLVRLMIVVRERGRPIFHWNTIGASGSALFDFCALWVLRNSSLNVREVASARYLKSKGLHAEVGYDTAFILPECVSGGDGDTLTLVPAELNSWHPEFTKIDVNSVILDRLMPELAVVAKAHGLHVQILPHLRSEAEAKFNAEVASRLESCGVPSKSITVRDDITTYRAYDAALGESRLVVGGRYHSVVLAAKNLRPFVSLAYENKMTEVCNYLGVPQLNVDLHAGEPEVAFRQALDFCLNREGELSTLLTQSLVGKLRPRIRFVLEQLHLGGHANSRTI